MEIMEYNMEYNESQDEEMLLSGSSEETNLGPVLETPSVEAILKSSRDQGTLWKHGQVSV